MKHNHQYTLNDLKNIHKDLNIPEKALELSHKCYMDAAFKSDVE